MSGLLVVGKNDCPVDRVMRALKLGDFNQGVLRCAWADVAGMFGVPDLIPVVESDEKGLAVLANVDATSMVDQVKKVIEKWLEKEGDGATLGYLMRTLRSVGLDGCAESLANDFKEEIAAAKYSQILKSEMNNEDGLLWAAGRGDVGLVEELLQRGADVNWKTDQGETALYRAADSDVLSMPIIKCLISKGADLDAMRGAYYGIDEWDQFEGNFFENLLPKLTPSQFHEFCESVFENGKADYFNKMVRPSRVDPVYETPLQLAVKGLDVERRTLKLLKENGSVDLNARDKCKRSLLHLAMEGGRSADCVADLIEIGGVYPCHRNDSQNTVYDELVMGKYGKVADGVKEILEEYFI